MRRMAPLISRPRGVALLMALVVVLLVTAYITEFFFTTGLELRSLQSFKDASQARNVARLVLKSLQIGMLNDEVEVMNVLSDVEKFPAIFSLPEGGQLVKLLVTPLDSLYNLNELYNIRIETDNERARWELFRKTMEEIRIPSEGSGLEGLALEPDRIANLYGALFDWIDKDDLDYQGGQGALGAEAPAYLARVPEVRIKNGLLDRLREIRLVQGVAESRIPWPSWEQHFTALPKAAKGGLYPEKLNINLASQEQIKTFLERRRMENLDLRNATQIDIQKGLNKFADNKDAIAEVLAPNEEERTKFTTKSLEEALKNKVTGIEAKYHSQVFSVVNQYYRVQLTAAMNNVETRLEAVLHVPRTASRIGTSVTVLQLTFE